MAASYSKRTKDELFNCEIKKDCCAAAQLDGMLLFGGVVEECKIRFASENAAAVECFRALFERVFLYEISPQRDGAVIFIEIRDRALLMRVFTELGLAGGESGRVIRRRIAPRIVEKDCCKRAFLRGAFLGGATVIDPRRNYSIEFVTHYRGLAQDFSELLLALSFKTRLAERAGSRIIYTKNSETVCDMLAAMGAPNAQMELINVKIEKELRNGMNRSANGETANYDKAVSAAVKQLRAIEKIDREIGIDRLPDDLKDLARARIKHKDAALSELGKFLNPPLTKSGVSHRMNRLMKLADKTGAGDGE